jgi:gluconolactonase
MIRAGLFSAMALAMLLPAAPAPTQAPAATPAPASPQPPSANEVIRLDPALDGLIAPGVNVETLTDSFKSAEGPMWRDGKIHVSDQVDGAVYALDAQGRKTLVVRDPWPIDPAVTVAQGPNGQVPDKNGAIIILRQGFRDVARLTPDGTFSPIVSTYQGKRFNSPNDLVRAPDGTIFFTDPSYSLPEGMDGPNSELHFEGVFSYKDGRLVAAITDLIRPNGIGISPNGKTLYVSTGSPGPRILAYDIQRDGTVKNGRNFYVWQLAPGQRGGADGMKVDTHGNIWAVGAGAVNVITPEGKNLGRIRVVGRAVSNVAFGGPDNKTLFITGGNYLYRIQTLATGLKLMYQTR